MKKGKRHSNVFHKKPSSQPQPFTHLHADETTEKAFIAAGVAVLAKASSKYSKTASKVDSWVGEPVQHLCGVLRLVTKSLIRIAETGDEGAAAQIWEASSELIKAIHSLALQNPRVLKPIARKALFFPSFRAKTKGTFTHNFDKLQRAIELSKDCLINTGPDALYNLESPATLLVAKKLEAVGLIRERMKEGERDWKQLVRRCHLKISLDDWLVEFCGHDRAELFLKDLPDYNKDSALQWFETVIKPYLTKPETLDRIRGTEFYDRLFEAAIKGKRGTPKDYGVVDELKKRCQRQVLTSLAPRVPQTPAV
jgi:hypothetical protein